MPLRGLRQQFSVPIAHVETRLTRTLLLVERESGVVHAERAGDMITEIAVEVLPARDLDHLPDIVEAAAIGPSCAWLEHQRLARQVRIVTRDLQIADEVRIPQQIAEARRVRQKLAQRDGLLREAQLRGIVCAEADEHFGGGERRIDIGGRLVQPKPALLYKLQSR